MYKFSKEAWHVKLFKWLFNEDPTKMYKTMCPYFWSYVVIIVTLPLIMVIKMFGKAGTKLLNRARTYKERQRTVKGEEFTKDLKINIGKLTAKDAYLIYKSSNWSEYYYSMTEKQRSKIIKLAGVRETEIAESKKVMRAKVKEYKESRSFTMLSYIFSISLCVIAGYYMYKLYVNYDFLPVDWDSLKAFLIVGVCIIIAVIVLRYIIYFLEEKGSILLVPFTWIWKGIKLVGDMVYTTYKKSCPLITWEDENKNK